MKVLQSLDAWADVQFADAHPADLIASTMDRIGAYKLSGAPVVEGDDRRIGIVAIVCGYISITASMRDEIASTLLVVSPGGAHAGRHADQFTPQA